MYVYANSLHHTRAVVFYTMNNRVEQIFIAVSQSGANNIVSFPGFHLRRGASYADRLLELAVPHGLNQEAGKIFSKVVQQLIVGCYRRAVRRKLARLKPDGSTGAV